MASSNSEYIADPPDFSVPTAMEGRPDVDPFGQVQPEAPSLYELYDNVQERSPVQSSADSEDSKHMVDLGRSSGMLMRISSSSSGEYSLSSVRSSLSGGSMYGRDEARFQELEKKVDEMEIKCKDMDSMKEELKEKTKQLEHLNKELELAKREALQEQREKQWFKNLSEEKQKKIEELEQEKAQLKQDVEQLRSDVARLKQDMDNVRNQNNGIQSSVDQMQRKMEQVQIPINEKPGSFKGSASECLNTTVAAQFSQVQVVQDHATATVSKMADKNSDSNKSHVGGSSPDDQSEGGEHSPQDLESAVKANNETSAS